MSFDEALIILSTGADFQKEKFDIAMKMGGMPRAVDEAMDIARECIKRCRDFDQIRRVKR